MLREKVRVSREPFGGLYVYAHIGIRIHPYTYIFDVHSVYKLCKVSTNHAQYLHGSIRGATPMYAPGAYRVRYTLEDCTQRTST